MSQLVVLITGLLLFCSFSSAETHDLANGDGLAIEKITDGLTYEDGLIKGFEKGLIACGGVKEPVAEQALEVVSSRCKCEGDKFGYVVREIVYSDGSLDKHNVSSKIQLRAPFQKVNCKKLVVEYCGV